MKTRISSKLSALTFGKDTQLEGRELVSEEDLVGHVAYDVKIPQGKTLSSLRAVKGCEWNHIYYCLNGNANFELHLEDGNVRRFTVARDEVLALTGQMDADVTTTSDSWFYIVYTIPTEGEPKATEPLYRRLSEVVGSERDVDWQRGRSRRFLARQDGFNVSVHNCMAMPNYSSRLAYKNIESVYWVDGRGAYIWNDGQSRQDFTHNADGEGTMILLDQHDEHEAQFTGEKPSIAICVFFPALIGTETHNFDGKVSFSSF